MRNVSVCVLLEGRKAEWRTVQTDNLLDAVEIAEAMPDVIAVLEASWVPGGVVT